MRSAFAVAAVIFTLGTVGTWAQPAINPPPGPGVLNGVKFFFKNGRLTVLATEGIKASDQPILSNLDTGKTVKSGFTWHIERFFSMTVPAEIYTYSGKKTPSAKIVKGQGSATIQFIVYQGKQKTRLSLTLTDVRTR